MQRPPLRLAVVPIALLAGCGFRVEGAAAPDLPDAPTDAPACIRPVSPPLLESLTRGELIVDATQTVNIAPLAVALDRSVLFTSIRSNEPSPQNGGLMCDLVAEDVPTSRPAGIRCTRAVAGTDNPLSDGSVHVAWTVATFTTGVSVQRGLANTGVANPTTVTLTTPVDPEKSVVLLGGVFAGGTGWGNNEFTRARLVDTSTLEVRTTVSGSQSTWQVVTIAGAAVQRGSASLIATATTAMAPLAAVKPGALVLASHTTDSPTTTVAAKAMLRASVSASGDAVQFERSMSGPVLDISWEVAALPFYTRTFTSTFAAGQATTSVPIPNLLASTSAALASGQGIVGQSSGSTDYAGTLFDLIGEAAVTLTVSDGMVTLQRATSTANATVSWTAIDFAHDYCDEL